MDTSSITVSNSEGVAIFVNNPNRTVIEVVIESDGIYLTSSSAKGIVIDNAQKVSVENVFIKGGFNSLLVEISSDVSLKNSHFFQATDASANVLGSSNVVFNNCVFKDSQVGLFVYRWFCYSYQRLYRT